MALRQVLGRLPRGPFPLTARSLSSESITYGASSSDVDALIEENLDKSTYRRREDESPLRLLTTRREALSLYREIWRVSALFDWPDERGRPWRDVLRESARQEFEAARFEADPEIVNRLLVVGRDSVHQVAERFLSKRQRMLDEAHRGGSGGGGLPGGPGGRLPGGGLPGGGLGGSSGGGGGGWPPGGVPPPPGRPPFGGTF